MGIQLSQDMHGTGYWTLTVYALGYADYTIQFQATEDNIAKPAGDADSTPLKNIIEEATCAQEVITHQKSWEQIMRASRMNFRRRDAGEYCRVYRSRNRSVT